MRAHDFPIDLDPQDDAPLFVQISSSLARDIARGRLRPGDALPGTRTLAETLGVHRSTVVTAYAELTAQGWVATRPGGATFVAASLPDVKPRRFAPRATKAGVADTTGFELEPAFVRPQQIPQLPPGGLYLWGGMPDPRLVPLDLLARAYRRVAQRQGRALFSYSADTYGHEMLRRAIARLATDARGLAATADNVLITRGSQMALDLSARSLIRPGDVVAVEALGYPNAVNVFRRAGAVVVPVRVDQHGIDVNALVALAREKTLRLIYVTPHHQYPTTVTLSATRRLALLDLARREHIAVLEDDYDQEFHYDGRPVLPLASSDPTGNVIYVGTLAKILAPGLRLAFVVAPAPLLARMAAERALIDRQGDAVLECSIAELIDDGDVERHVRRTRRIYRSRRDAFCENLERELGGVIRFRRPPGGMAIWADVAPELDVEAWQECARQRGVYFQIGRQFALDGAPIQSVRFGFAFLDEKESATGIRRLGEAASDLRGRALPRARRRRVAR
ncbi:MAG TPA: PLP-dependent aminotransferase family protein [Polyangiaceae bacterium]|nr:PLP-dependent aminotransferase family protein [Polyangiaceae bacterium]